MAAVGPELPPSGAEKRKRHKQQDQDDRLSDSASAKRARPSESSIKRPRVLGPSLSPTNLDDPPTNGSGSETESSNDDDDFGPNLPSVASAEISEKPECGMDPFLPPAPKPLAKTQRDEWMVVPPSSSDWTSRVDVTKLRNRKFNSSKGAKGPSQPAAGDDVDWTESLAEKKARLEREMMGIKDIPKRSEDPHYLSKPEARSQKLKEYTEKFRGPTLYKEHQKSNPRGKEDDPSARAFDREKDIAGGIKINHRQRKEMMKKASDFGSRFSRGKYL